MNNPSTENSTTISITPELVSKINTLLDKGLTKGLGKQIEGQMCVEALICCSLGLPHTDNPPCVGKYVRAAKIELNDCIWSSNKARAEGMRKLAIAQLNSITINQEVFFNTLKLISTKRVLPFLIQKHFDITKDAKLLEYRSRFQELSKLDDNLWKEFYNNYNHYNHYNHYNYNNYYYYNNYFGDEFLLLIADCILEALKTCKSPGCEWL